MTNNNNNDDLVIGVSLDTSTIKRGANKIVGDIDFVMGGVTKKFDALGKQIDKSMSTAMQTRIDSMVGIGTKASKEWTGALAQQGAELDKLRSKYNPVFAAVNNYKASVVSIQQAHRMGAISSDEMTAAIQRERKATLDSIAAIKQRNTAVTSMQTTGVDSGVNRFNTANIAAQFQDIAVTSAMGMSPLQIALQQGTQLSAVFNEMGKGRDVIKGISAAFMSVISPVSLVTIGVIAAGAALTQYAISATSVKKIEDILEENRKKIAEITVGYKEAQQAYENYIAAKEIKPAGEAREDAQATVKQRKEDFEKAQKGIAQYSDVIKLFGNRSLGTEIAAQAKAMAALAASAGQADADMGKISASLAKMTKEGLASSELKGWGGTLKKLIDDAKRLQTEIGATEAAADKITPATEAFSRLEVAINSISSVKARKELTELLEQVKSGDKGLLDIVKAIDGLSGKYPDMSNAVSELNKVALEALKAKVAINQLTLAQGGDLSKSFPAGEKGGRLGSPTMDEMKERNQALFDEQLNFMKRWDNSFRGKLDPSNKQLNKTPKTKVDRDANAYRDLVKSAQDRIDQLQLEEQLIGKTGVAADTLRMRLDLLQRAEDKGREISASQRLELEAKATAYSKLAEKVGALSAAEELRFEREQLFRSPTEQRVASQLRNIGLDANSSDGKFLASQIRLNETLAESRDLLMDIGKGFSQDLMNGVKFMDALSNAAGRLGDKLIDMAMDQAITALFGNLMGSFGGGGGNFKANTTLGNFLQGIPGFANGTNNAPGGLSLVGERGPELLNIPRGAQVIPNDILRNMSAQKLTGPRVPSMPAGSGSNAVIAPVHISIDATGADAEGLGRVQEQLKQLEKSIPERVIQTVRKANNSFTKLG